MTHATTKNRLFALDSLRWPMAIAVALLAGAFIFGALPARDIPAHLDRDAAAAARAQIKHLKTAVLSYKLEFNQLPERLDQLIDNPARPFLDADEIPLDPWGNPYLFNVSGESFRIASLAVDGHPGGTGKNEDITSESL